MRLVDHSFTEPQRQSMAAMLQIIYKTYRVIVRQLWPFLIVFLFGGSSDAWGTKVAMVLIVLALLSMVVSVVGYFRYTFYIEEGDLIVNRGILIRKKLVLPLQKIQSINIQQNLLHRLMGVVGVQVDTAGSAGEEITIDALSMTTAEALKSNLLRGKMTAKDVDLSDHDLLPALDQLKSKQDVVHAIDIKDLLVVGLTENHLKSGWIIIAFCFWVFSELEGVGVETMDYLPTLQSLAVLTTYLLGVFLVASVLISLTRVIVKYYGLSFVREEDGFKLEHGLFTKQSISAADSKIQTIAWRDNLLRKLVGLYQLSIKQVGSQALNSKKPLTIAGIRRSGIDQILIDLFGRVVDRDVTYAGVHVSWRNRRIAFVVGPLMVLAGVLLYLQEYYQMAAVILFIGYWIYASWRAYRKLGYSILDDYLLLSGGAWGDYRTIIPFHKLQNVSYTTSPYQRRHGLVTVRAKTAAGIHTIPYLPRGLGQQVRDKLLYEVEVRRQDWM